MKEFELIDDCVDNIDNTLSVKQQKRRREKIMKWIEKEMIDNIQKNKGIAKELRNEK